MIKTRRNVIVIDEDLCNGCGQCVPGCAEGALQIVNGKAKLVSDVYCDGLGACVGECPTGALRVEEREAAPFDPHAVEEHLSRQGRPAGAASHAPGPNVASPADALRRPHGGGCPGSRTLDFRGPDKTEAKPREDGAAPQASELRQWPVKLYLVSPNAPYFENAELLLAADCAPLAYASFHPDFLRGKAVVIGCPKFDDVNAYLSKLTAILSLNNIRKVTVIHMEVPCCFGLMQLAQRAIQESGKNVPLEEATVGLRGDVVVAATR